MQPIVINLLDDDDDDNDCCLSDSQSCHHQVSSSHPSRQAKAEGRASSIEQCKPSRDDNADMVQNHKAKTTRPATPTPLTEVTVALPCDKADATCTLSSAQTSVPSTTSSPVSKQAAVRTTRSHEDGSEKQNENAMTLDVQDNDKMVHANNKALKIKTSPSLMVTSTDDNDIPGASLALSPTARHCRIVANEPSSADSALDDLTLAEMAVLVKNGQARGREPWSGIRKKDATKPSSSLTTLPTKRSLAQALKDVSNNNNNTGKMPSSSDQDSKVVRGDNRGRFKRSNGTVAAGVASSSLNRCVPLTALPTDCLGALDASLPDFSQIVNFPHHRYKRSCDGRTKVCVMCGQYRPYLQKRKLSDGKMPFVLADAKGICSSCETTVWHLVERDLHIMWCEQRLHFCPLVSFLVEGTGVHEGIRVRKSCAVCRHEMKERYRARKEKQEPACQDPGGAAAVGTQDEPFSTSPRTSAPKKRLIDDATATAYEEVAPKCPKVKDKKESQEAKTIVLL